MVIRATNKTNKRYADITVTINADAPDVGSLPGTVGSLPKTKAETEAELPEPEARTEPETESEAVEPSVTLGAPRTAESLSAGQRAFLTEKGYEVVAILPEVTATVDGQYEFEVELSEDAPEGAKLLWLAFPKDAPSSTDDEIVDFYDEAGASIEEVPASRKVIASPWLRGGVTYTPVIAVETK